MILTPLQEAENTWRVIPEFEHYEINLLKDIRFTEHKQKVYHALSVNGIKYYQFLNDEGKYQGMMNADHILDVTFPELKENR